MKNRIVYLGLLCLLWACNNGSAPPEQEDLFELKDNQAIGIDFSNDLTYTREFNVYKYRNFYNGGGVAIGDVNNDGHWDAGYGVHHNQNSRSSVHSMILFHH